MKNSSKSRIPIPVTKQNTSNQCYAKKNSQVINSSLKKQTLGVIKTTNAHLQEKTEKKMCSQPEKSKKLKSNNMNNTDFKNKYQKTKTNNACISINNKTFQRNMKPVDNDKLTACKDSTTSNSAHKGITRTCNVNVINKRFIASSATNIKSCLDKNADGNIKENISSPKSHPFEVEACTPGRNEMFSKDCFSAQEPVEFEANELYRNMILSNIELSPSNRKLMPNLRLSSLISQRPSVYQKQKLQIPDDPLKEALRALENTCLSVNRVKKENVSSLKIQSPCRSVFRDSIYTPRGDPNKELDKKLEDFKLKQKTTSRSTRKVTFNLNIQECTPNNICDIQQNLLNSEHRLMQINEKSEENTPNSPPSFKSSESKLDSISSKDVHNISNQITEDCVTITDVEHKETQAASKGDIALKSSKKIIEPIMPYVDKSSQFSVQIKKEICCADTSLELVCDKENVEKYAKSMETNNLQLPEQKVLKKTTKIYTPKPILLSSKVGLNQSYSPEFLVNGKSAGLSNLAPICTPLVLKSQAKSIMFSPEPNVGPIPLKLDFTEEEKNTPKKETCKNPVLFALDNIVTIQKQLDALADQECCLSLINESFPVICGRYLTNPLAKILNEGDDMHFIPIRL